MHKDLVNDQIDKLTRCLYAFLPNHITSYSLYKHYSVQAPFEDMFELLAVESCKTLDSKYYVKVGDNFYIDLFDNEQSIKSKILTALIDRKTLFQWDNE